MMDHHGWHAAKSFTDPDGEATQARESVGLADVSWTPKFNLQGHGLKTPPDLGPGASWWPIARLQYLVMCETSADQTAIEHFLQMQFQKPNAASSAPIYVTDVTSVYAHLLLAGPRSRDVLNKLTSLNLSDEARGNLTCAQSSVAHVHATVLRQDLGGTPAYHLLVGREYGESVWKSVLHAGHEFRITPFGVKALELMQG
jgi:sarcosine oxidase subunit alpha